jgi:DnaJ domain
MDGTRARALLGVAEHATHDDLRRAFRQRALATHPDVGGDPEAFVHTLTAFKLLQTQPSVGKQSNVVTFDPNRRIDTYDYVAPRARNHNRVSFQDVLDSAVRQRVAAA